MKEYQLLWYITCIINVEAWRWWWDINMSSIISYVPSLSLLFFSHSVMSDSLPCHRQQHIRLPCPSPYDRVCPSSRPLVDDDQSSLPLLFLLLLSSVFHSIRVFSNELVLHIKWPKYWSFSFSISPSNEYSGLISFRIDWFDLLAVQWALKNLLQHHSSKASTLQPSAFFMVQLSHPHMTTGKTIALTIWNFFSKVMSLFFNMLSRFVIAFLPRSKHLLIS